MADKVEYTSSRIVEKAYAYITHDARLLVFEHVGIPEAGWQVPGGTLEPGETPEAAVLREVSEETGLTTAAIHCYLGENQFDARPFGRDELHRRHFFHLTLREPPPDQWQHLAEGQYTFAYTWAPLPDGVPPLIADFGALLPALMADPYLMP